MAWEAKDKGGSFALPPLKFILRHSGARDSANLRCAIAHRGNLEIPGSMLRIAPE
jgi:hypothetical protein